MAKVINVEAMMKAADFLGLKVIKKNQTLEALEPIIKTALEEKVLDAECPECGNDIPDEMTFCPFCGVSFDDDESGETETTETDESGETETEGDENADESGETETTDETETGETDGEESEETEKPLTAKEKAAAEKAAKEAEKEAKEAEKAAKAAAKTTKEPKAPKINEMTTGIMAEVDKIADKNNLEIRDRSVLYSVFKGEERLFSVMKNSKNLTVYFCTEVGASEGLTVLTADEAKQKHLGRIRGIYEGTDAKIATKLMNIAAKAK